MGNSDAYGLHDFNKNKLAESFADQDARAERLAPECVNRWTTTVSTVAGRVRSGSRPCDYRPWLEALNDGATSANLAGPLMDFASDIAQPGWPEPRPDLVGFALAFLEADVMLFRSGYVKRHLIKRLQQSPLSSNDIKRIDALLRRAVTVGSSLEEFKGYRRLAAHLVVNGWLDTLSGWLALKAEGAILTIDKANGGISADMFSHPDLSERDKRRLQIYPRFFGRSKWGITYPNLSEVVPAGSLVKEKEERIKYAAYLMLRCIQRRQDSTPIAR